MFIRYQRLISLALFCWFSAGCIQAQWLVEARNIKGEGYNTQLFFTPPENFTQRTEIYLGFREEGRKEYKLQDQFYMLPGQTFPLAQNYQLPHGDYQAVVTFDGLSSGPASFSYACNPVDPALFTSDIYLSPAPFPQKTADISHFSRIGARQDSLFFRCELHSKLYRQLTARAVLYRDRTKGTEAKATVFTSIQQQNEVLDLNREKAVFQGLLDLQALRAGDYLLEVLIFEDDQLLRERSVRFSIEWQGYAQLMADLDQAIDMLSPLASEADIQEMLRIPKESDKRLAFENWWKNFASEDQSLQIATYYQKLSEADALFDDALPAWKSDRGKAYLLYGKPNRREIVKNGVRYERWFYEEWNLILWFQQEGENFISIN